MTVTPEFKEASSRAAIRALRGLEQTAVMLEKWGLEDGIILKRLAALERRREIKKPPTQT